MRFPLWPVLWMFVAAPVTAAAQSTLYALLQAEPFSSCQPPACSPESGALVEIDADAGRVSSVRPVSNARGLFQQLGVTPDGRYVAWTGTEARAGTLEPTALDALTAFDRVSRESAELFRVPSPSAGADAGTISLLMHPGRAEAIARFADPPVLALAPTGIRRVEASCTSAHLEDISPDGSAVVLACPGAAAVVDLDTGVERHRLPIAGVAPQDARWAINRDLTELFRASRPDLPLVTRFSLPTGTVLAQRTLDAQDAVSLLRVDPRTGRLFAALVNGTLLVLASDTLEILWRIAPRLPALVPSLPGYNEPVTIRRVVFERDRPRAFMLATRQRRHPLPPPYGYETQIDAIDTDALMLTDGGTLLLDAPVVDLALVPLPPRPRALTSIVQGSHVTLQWAPGTEPGAATRYKVEVSVSPGGPYFATETPLTAIAAVVPRGRYFVRVRGVNFGGTGPPSAEIEVRVPQ